MSAPANSVPIAPTAAVPASSSAPSTAPGWWGANLSLNFNVKTTLIYIGGSLGVLGVIMCFLMLTMILWVRPSRRRRLEALTRERHRLDTLREVKVEPDNFTPQVRAFPVVVLQPDDSEVACGRKISLEATHSASQSADIETGEIPGISNSHGDEAKEHFEGSSPQRQGSREEKEEPQIAYNPLTHYLTEREPHLFVAEFSTWSDSRRRSEG